jgi:hypothetical protein
MATNPELSPLARPAAPPVETPVSEDPRERAARRLAQLQGNWGTDMPPDTDSTDRFYFDPLIIPDGWSYEWKTFEVLGKQDPHYQVELSITGWEAVPAKRHPELMPEDWAGATIDRQGMRLMERPKVITENAQERERRKARLQVSNKEASLAGETAGAFDERKPVIKRSTESIAIPK